MRLGTALEGGEKALGEVDIESDQNEFVRVNSANLSAWSLPPDLGWEESPVWHDSVSPSFLTTSQRLTKSRTERNQHRANTSNRAIESQDQGDESTRRTGSTD